MGSVVGEDSVRRFRIELGTAYTVLLQSHVLRLRRLAMARMSGVGVVIELRIFRVNANKTVVRR